MSWSPQLWLGMGQVRSTSMQYTHTHTHSVLHSSLDFDAINRMKVHRGILFVPIGGGTCRDVGKEQREFPWNR